MVMRCNKNILGQHIVSPPTIPMNIATRMASVDSRGGQGLYIVPLDDPIKQQPTNIAVAAYVMHGR